MKNPTYIAQQLITNKTKAMYYIIEYKTREGKLIDILWNLERAEAKVFILLSEADDYTTYEICKFKKAYDKNELTSLKEKRAINILKEIVKRKRGDLAE